jgi:catechol 2,3-dioxygenase-like lactoylglutathione lyase family enzyme
MAQPGYSLVTYVLDCPDPARSAAFYRELLGWETVDADEEWVTLRGGGGAEIAFQRVADYRPPTWPEGERAQMAHLDFDVEDLPAEHDRALGSGAKLLDDTHETFRVYADLDGHPFCLCAC